ncbi:MAG: methylaspartate mutase, partial [Chloroflexi bacterium]|nr:methylaspartate mutase [Chloroflexota bacterium]
MCILTIEVGSTITKVNGFYRSQHGALVQAAQGFAPTSITQGDVMPGVELAMQQVKDGANPLDPEVEIFINSSAAGGLRMTVHGLTYNMTARAAREAALGAGAIVKKVTAGLLDEFELSEIRQIHPNIILLAGGVDYGEKETVLENARRIANLGLQVPVVYQVETNKIIPLSEPVARAGVPSFAKNGQVAVTIDKDLLILDAD